MMQQYAQLVLFTDDAAQVADLKLRFTSDPHIRVSLGNGPDVSSRLRLDALWVTPMQASYFGVSQQLPFEKASVFPMPKHKRALGLPPLLIAGVALAPGKEYSDSFIARIPATALADAISDYNATHDLPIGRVGSIPHNLCLDGSRLEEASRAIRIAFAGLQIQSEEKPFLQIRQHA